MNATKLITMKKKIFLSAFLIISLLIFGCIKYFFWGDNHTILVEYGSKIEVISLPESPKNTYSAKVKLKGTISCDTEIQFTLNSKPYDEPILLKAGYVNELMYNGDWYNGPKIRLNITPLDSLCENNELSIYITYYN